jgi:hypothetical protein
MDEFFIIKTTAVPAVENNISGIIYCTILSFARFTEPKKSFFTPKVAQKQCNQVEKSFFGVTL